MLMAGFQNVSRPLSGQPESNGTFDRLTEYRRRFYECLIKLTWAVGGDVSVLEVEEWLDGHSTKSIGAILLWLPPRTPNFSISSLFSSGYWKLALFQYGWKCTYRTLYIYEGNIAKMWKTTGIRSEQCAFVQMIASSDKLRGQGLASQLLRDRIQAHFARSSEDVLLDTTTTQGVRAYLRIGFKLIAEKKVATNTDALGIRMRRSDPEYSSKKTLAETICIQRVMQLKVTDFNKG